MSRDLVFVDRFLLRHIGSFVRPRDARWLCRFCAVYALTYYTHRSYNRMMRVCDMSVVMLERAHEHSQASPEYQEAFYTWLAQLPDWP